MKTSTSRKTFRTLLLLLAASNCATATAQQARTDANSTSAEPSKAKPVSPSATQLDVVHVTGTRIKGGATPSPLVSIDHTQIRQEGFADLGEVIRSLPQNFAGGQNPGVASGAAAGGPSNQNLTGGAGVNLRGLGPDATLSLLNGRRLSYGGAVQAVDLGAIPLAAVERIEVVPDGASAVYGSDAVGGVANVILRRDFDGVTLGTRFGGATDGGLLTREWTATAGTTWDGGGLILAGQKTDNDPINATQRPYTQAMYRPSTLWQDNALRSGVLSLHQALGEAAELRVDALRTLREANTATAYASVYYPYRVRTRASLVAPSLQVWLGDAWTLTLGATLGQDKARTAQPTYSRATGTRIADSLGSVSNRSTGYEAGVEGPVLDLPAGEARLAAGLGYRRNDLLNLGLSRGVVNADGSQSSRYGYAEVSLPLVAPDQGVRAVHRLEVTGALRREDGDDGQVTTPKLGLVWSPTADVSLKGSWGKSFKAPTLTQRFATQTAIAYAPATFGGSGYPPDATVLWRSGGNRDLQPERARTWSASLALHPAPLPQLEAELTWFDIDYTQRIVQPITAYDVLGNARYVDFVSYAPGAAVVDAAVAGAGSFYNYAGVPFDAGQVVAIVDGRYVNAQRQRIKGADLSGAYRFDLGTGRLTVRGAASWLDSRQALTDTQPEEVLAGTLFHPARLNARLGAVWNVGGLTASVFGNHRSGVRNPADGRDGASFTTFDGTLRYEAAADAGWLEGMAFELAGQNLLNRAPPSYVPTSLTYAPYDSTNYSAVGRFVSVAVSRHW